MKKLFITVERLKSLQESIGWLDAYVCDEESPKAIIGDSIDDTTYLEETELLKELGEIQLRAIEIKKILLSL